MRAITSIKGKGNGDAGIVLGIDSPNLPTLSIPARLLQRAMRPVIVRNMRIAGTTKGGVLAVCVVLSTIVICQPLAVR
ncbi:hypothetical protein [uncultured Chloroflexus sp.]|uniref:hypothetical protein n=1 Tax=uncultured Chloroflexus sp. TaxID=214040 RepID=UPI00261F07A0|nr:hypothetical protein [uncultured Chloroflexus sp.]